jgi:hypothetical protein
MALQTFISSAGTVVATAGIVVTATVPLHVIGDGPSQLDDKLSSSSSICRSLTNCLSRLRSQRSFDRLDDEPEEHLSAVTDTVPEDLAVVDAVATEAVNSASDLLSSQSGMPDSTTAEAFSDLLSSADEASTALSPALDASLLHSFDGRLRFRFPLSTAHE